MEGQLRSYRVTVHIEQVVAAEDEDAARGLFWSDAHWEAAQKEITVEEEQDETREDVAACRGAEERDRQFLLTLVKTRASCYALLGAVSVLAFLCMYDVSLRDITVRGFMVGTLITVTGLLFWAERAIPEVSRRVFGGPDEDEGQG
jgi:hypothetical protein